MKVLSKDIGLIKKSEFFIPKGKKLTIYIYKFCWKVKVLPKDRCLAKMI
jgi:hypothetical protein